MKRPPVITILGHVDHGKTTLLDYIRKANVAAREAGGITQATSAYEIEHQGQKLTFIDTPGHEAFSHMRSRGAKIADIAILVVAADDGVKPQTKEVIETLKARSIPFIVAINKIDKTNADIEKTKNDLANNDVLLEGFGGDVSFQTISAKDGKGVSDLLDLLVLAVEMEDLKYDPTLPPSGFILEARKDSQSGILITAIVKNGTLRTGEEIHTKSANAKIKGLKNFLGQPVKELSPSAPAVIMGFENLPQTGETFGMEDKESDSPEAAVQKEVDPERAINLIVKADVSGSLEALKSSVLSVEPPEDKDFQILDSGVGNITDGDVRLASSCNAIIIGFNTKTEPAAKRLSQEQKVMILESKIIYHLLEELQKKMKGVHEIATSGRLEILAVFNDQNNQKQVVGGRVVEGAIKLKGKFQIKRGAEIVGSGIINNLQQGKQEAQSVDADKECGMMVKASTKIIVGDNFLQQ